MAQIKVYYDREGNTLTVWFGNPADEYIAEESGEEIVLMKDRDGKVIGFEKLNFTALPSQMHCGSLLKQSLPDRFKHLCDCLGPRGNDRPKGACAVSEAR
jgi:uncharacterized protein YuzE